MKFCSKCGFENEEDYIFCRKCGKKLSENNSLNLNNISREKILIGTIVVLLLIIAIIGTYSFVTMNNNDNSDSDNDSIATVSDISSVRDSSSVATKSWHKVDSFNGVGDYSITLNAKGNPIRVTSSAFPIKNYADNFMYTTVSQNGNTVGSSQLSWNSRSAVATRSDTIEFTGSGTYSIYISAYELQYWNLEIYEYY